MSKPVFAIDAGHGLYTPGKRCLKAIDPAETREWVLNSRIADKLQRLLADYDCTTFRVDDPTGQNDVPLSDRVAKANRTGAAAYISIHHNAGVNGGSGGGIVVFTARTASQTSKALQEAVYRHTVERTGLKGNRSTPLAEKDLYVLRKTDMPAVLGEFGFMDSTSDTPVILTEEFADQVAGGIAAALAEVFRLEGGEESMTDEQFDALMQRWLTAQAAKPATMPEHVARAVELGITTGENPCGLATREQVATMVANAVDKV